MFEMKLATCAALMGVLPESTGSLKTSYFSRESNTRAASPKEARGHYLPLNRPPTSNAAIAGVAPPEGSVACMSDLDLGWTDAARAGPM